MPFNGSGGFVPLAAPIYPAVSGTIIVAAYFNSTMQDVFDGLAACVTRNGQSPAAANLPMGGFLHTDLGQASAVGETLAWGRTASVTNLTVSGNLTVTGTATGTFNGNAATATRLQTPRLINGVAFDGTSDITVSGSAVNANSLIGGTLAANVLNSSLTSVGTLGALTVSGTVTAGQFNGPLVGAVTGNVVGNLTGNVTGNVTGSSGSSTGNAATATALQTARTINGTSFNGTANITLPLQTAVGTAITDTGNYYTTDNVEAAFAQIGAAGLGVAAGTSSASLPGGLILKWGTIGSVLAGATISTVFGVAFPTSCYIVVVTNGNLNNTTLSASAISVTGFDTNNTSANGAANISWFAVGR